MRIAVVNNFYPPRVGGSAHLSDALAAAYVDAGHEVLVITAQYRGAPREEVRHGARVVRLPSWTMPKLGTAVDFDIAIALGPRNLRRVMRLLDDFAPDVVHQHGQFFDLTWMSGWWCRRRRVPALLSVHTRLESPSRGYGAVFRVLDALLVRPITSLWRPVFVVMDRLMDDYIARRYTRDPRRTVAIPVGVHLPPHGVERRGAAEVRARHGLGTAPVILSLGHVIPLRDRVALVEALPAIIARRPDVKVVVVGAVHYPRFLERARELGVEEHLVITGAVPREQVNGYLAAAEVETHDLQGYGLGTASLEAMASGVPVVAAVRADNFPGIELCSGENVVLVDLDDPQQLADRICELLDDPELRASIGKSQADLVHEHFSLTAVARKHLETLADLVAASSSAPVEP
jgi:1,2-diacylglycerol 3-alpha-glucosyltransferase